MLGHASLLTTMKYVNHVELDDQAAALPPFGPTASMQAPPDGLTSAEVAAMLAVSVHTVGDLRRQGKLEAMKVGRELRYDPASVEGLRAERAGLDRSPGWKFRGQS